MKKKLLALGAVIIAPIAFTVTSYGFQSGGGVQSFNVTNNMVAQTAITGYPTNQITTNIAFGTTNSVWYGTGTGVYVGYVDTVGINLQGYLVTTNTNSSVIGIGFVTSMAQNPPQITLGTNVWSATVTNMQASDWVNTNYLTWVTWTLPTNSASAGFNTNFLNLQTNLPNTSLAAANATWIGIYSITNSLSTGSFITNLWIGANSKLLVKPFSP